MALLHLHRRHGSVERTRVARGGWFPAPLQFLVALIGAGLVALGIAVLVRGGVSGSDAFDEHSTRIFSIDHTPRVAVVEIVAGVLLMASALRAATSVIGSLIGTAMVAVGVMTLVGTPSVVRDIGTNDAGGWVAIVAGAVVVIACSARPLPRTTVADPDVA